MITLGELRIKVNGEEFKVQEKLKIADRNEMYFLTANKVQGDFVVEKDTNDEYMAVYPTDEVIDLINMYRTCKRCVDNMFKLGYSRKQNIAMGISEVHDNRSLKEIVENIEKIVSELPKRKEVDVEQISKKLSDKLNNKKGHYVEVKDDLGLISKTFYIEDEDNENV